MNSLAKCLLNTKSVNCGSFPVEAALDLSHKNCLKSVQLKTVTWTSIKTHKQLQKRISKFLTNWGTVTMAVEPPCSSGYVDLANRHFLFCIRKLCILCSKREGAFKTTLSHYRWFSHDITAARLVYKTVKWGPCWCTVKILWGLNSFLMLKLPFVPKNFYGRWPCE